MIVIYNYLIGCACLCSKDGDKYAQELAGRYFFTQFWAEFTIEVLTEFHKHDASFKKAIFLE